MTLTRSSLLGPGSRPVAIPTDFSEESIAGTSGVVRLHSGIWWSGAPLVLDSENHDECIRLYEIVLTEGTDEDVREYISFNTLQSIWAELYLPRHVRTAWDRWFSERAFRAS